MGMANMRMPLTLQLFCPLLLLDVPAYRIGQQPTSPTPFYCLLCLCPIPTPSPSPLPQTASAPPSLIRLTPLPCLMREKAPPPTRLALETGLAPSER